LIDIDTTVKFKIHLFNSIFSLHIMHALHSRRNCSCCRETAQCFVSLNILISHSRSLKIIRN